MNGRLRTLAVALPLALTLASCGTDASTDQTGGDDAGTTGATTESADGKTQVVASFYPLEYVVTRVAGDHADVSALTRPGVDPHDVELTPKEVAALGSADLVVFSAGMQPAVDKAVDTQAAAHSFNVDEAADLLALDESEEEHTDHADEDHGAEDPHFWLDPQRYADVAEAIAGQLSKIDPDRAADYEANAAGFVADLEALDEAYTAGLAQCESRELVTTHQAFGYLAERYDLRQTGITGITPESEPSAARLAEITAQVRDQGITTIYTEPLLSPTIAQTVAQETGAQVLTLDPAAGLSDASAGDDYLGIMRANLDALRDGLNCA